MHDDLSMYFFFIYYVIKYCYSKNNSHGFIKAACVPTGHCRVQFSRHENLMNSYNIILRRVTFQEINRYLLYLNPLFV